MNVVYAAALRGILCAILPWRRVLYSTALGEYGVRYCTGGVWFTMLPWGGYGVRYYLQAEFCIRLLLKTKSFYLENNCRDNISK